MHVVIVGGDRVGLPTALSFARIGHQVWVMDTDPERVAALNNGVSSFYEPGLDWATQDFLTTNTLLGFFAALQLFSIGLLADLVVRLSKPQDQVDPTGL